DAEHGLKEARTSPRVHRRPKRVPAIKINRDCSSGLQSIAIAANEIAQGKIDVAIGAGDESMSMIPFVGNKMSFSKEILA
ncbi:acetyl-CoA C-acyltransferase, partial [Francisella tularensis subsp. holarctica]|nr:acetyl-CoA C-acyltransferase [Francisella tularensis subsp. holarctica]